MLGNLKSLLIHFVGAALAFAQLAYWSIRLMTPPSVPAPTPARAVAVHDPDPVLLARAFGQVEGAAQSVGNIQLAGVFAAGPDSAAVFMVGDRPARAVRLGQEVAPGSRLVDVDPRGVTLESGGVKRELRVPNAPMASMGAGAARSAPFERRGNVLSAPTLDTVPTVRAPGGRSPPGSLPAPREPQLPVPAMRGALSGQPPASQ